MTKDERQKAYEIVQKGLGVTIKAHIDMWNWLSKVPTRYKCDYLPRDSIIPNACFLCLFGGRRVGVFTHLFEPERHHHCCCPLHWPAMEYNPDAYRVPCETLPSPYVYWQHSAPVIVTEDSLHVPYTNNTELTRVDYATRVRDLPRRSNHSFVFKPGVTIINVEVAYKKLTSILQEVCM